MVKNSRIFSPLHLKTGKIFEKSIFLKIWFSRFFYILSLRSFVEWPRSLIFIEILEAVFEKPKIFDFVRFLSRKLDEIEKVARLFSIESVKRYG